MTNLRRSILIVFGGLPGTGKTSISRELTKRLSATYLRIDTIEQSLVAERYEAGKMGYVLANALAAENLRLDRAVIADCVNPLTLSRNGWRETAARCSAPIVEIEVICSNVAEHRKRVETRLPDIGGQVLPTWEDIVSRQYEPWDREHLVLDTAVSPLHDLVDQAEAYIRRDID